MTERLNRRPFLKYKYFFLYSNLLIYANILYRAAIRGYIVVV